MRRTPVRRTHFIPLPRESAVAAICVAQGEAAEMPYWIRKGINKVFGASPAIVFEPSGPQASITRTIRKAPSAKQRAAWARWAAMMNGGDDYIRGYDDGECMEPRNHH